jgi:hypothetical protein
MRIQAIRTSSKGLPRDTALSRARPGRRLLTFLRCHLPHNERAGRDRISNLLELNLALLFTSLPHRLHELINLSSPTLCTGALIVTLFDPLKPALTRPNLIVCGFEQTFRL